MTTLTKLIPGIILIAILTTFSHTAVAQSQATMTADANKKYQQADKELNTVFAQIVKEYSKKPFFVRKMKAAQRLWIKLRNADLTARFPDAGGSSAAMCKAFYLENVTRERTKYLRAWITGIPEGDVCSGSIKIGQP
ncbi:lysozyme inhibitor LprI family protein [Mucilaginibacter aquatilis]|uniref:DUF1311 domain-containing protein n=1 Tax=Mucilaginibacter aquatilis TaxID=1517760 RepID=A0A6I4IAX0_9SPHI|nr:lysozyme inhibitor LprI family protein [Mucilaginibacter aquatilis]MVN92325.1 DUF1311 domain-containing protein [Mucilaginibacter aquatilis]